MSVLKILWPNVNFSKSNYERPWHSVQGICQQPLSIRFPESWWMYPEFQGWEQNYNDALTIPASPHSVQHVFFPPLTQFSSFEDSQTLQTGPKATTFLSQISQRLESDSHNQWRGPFSKSTSLNFILSSCKQAASESQPAYLVKV